MIDIDPTAEPDLFLAELTLMANRDETAQGVIAAHVESHIGHEYGRVSLDERRTSRSFAEASVRMAIYRHCLARTGSDTEAGRMATGLASSIVRTLVSDGLAARLCQCRQLHPYGCPHRSAVGQLHCDGHTEPDVPELSGARLCGTCHVAEYQAQQAQA